MRKMILAILGCTVCVSLFSGCTDKNCCSSESKISSSVKKVKQEVKMITTDYGLKYEVLK